MNGTRQPSKNSQQQIKPEMCRTSNLNPYITISPTEQQLVYKHTLISAATGGNKIAKILNSIFSTKLIANQHNDNSNLSEEDNKND